jgi:hypothetical protein
MYYTCVIYYYYCYYYEHVSIARARIILHTVHAFIIMHVCFFFAVVIFRPAQLLSETSLSYRARGLRWWSFIYFFPVYLFYSFFRPFVYRCYCYGVRCVLKNHNRITMHHSLRSVRFFTTVSPKAEKINTKQNT